MKNGIETRKLILTLCDFLLYYEKNFLYFFVLLVVSAHSTDYSGTPILLLVSVYFLALPFILTTASPSD